MLHKIFNVSLWLVALNKRRDGSILMVRKAVVQFTIDHNNIDFDGTSIDGTKRNYVENPMNSRLVPENRNHQKPEFQNPITYSKTVVTLFCNVFIIIENMTALGIWVTVCTPVLRCFITREIKPGISRYVLRHFIKRSPMYF